MLSAVRKHKLLVLMLGMAVIYALQFLALPLCFPQFYPVSNEAWSILIIPLVAFSAAMNILVDANIGNWAMADSIYCLLAVLYNGNGFYGIGKRGIALDGMTPLYSFGLAAITILIITFVLFAFQMLIRGIRIIFLKARKQ